ncbi:MAG: EamA family transporter [Pseudomonadota bacterium]|jgi:drug/metabolite transporter (DMT)-like permease|nr:EamA family transporter [Pseudomonadota bacterium]
MTQNSNGREFALLGVLALLWGGSYPLISVAVETIPPLTLIALRVSVAALFLMAIVHLHGERLPRDPISWRRLLIQAFFNSIGAWTVLAWGQQFVESGLASVLNSTSPIFVVLATLGQWSGMRSAVLRCAGAGAGLVGVVLIVGPDVLNGLGRDVLAQGAVILGAMLYAGAALYGRHLSHLSARVTAAGTMIWASVWLIPAAVIVDRPWTLNPSAESLAAAVALALFSTAFAMTIYFRLIRTLGPAGVASQSYLRAGIGVVLGVVLLGETIEPTVWGGIATALAGVVLINLASRTRR